MLKVQSRRKLFIENFLVYGFGGVISKLVPLIMLPILTRLYPKSDYLGLNDLSNTFISFASALAMCGMYDAMFRLFFDKDDIVYQKKICSTSFFYVIMSTLLFSLIAFILKQQIASWYFGNEKYDGLVVLTIIGFLISTTNQIVAAPTRIQNKRKIFLVTNTVSPIISYAVAIPLVLAGQYIIAMPIAAIISGIVMEMSFGIMNKKYFGINSFDITLLKALLVIGIPLMPNFIVYWIYNSSDKVMISKLLSTADTGIYSVASRIGHISNLIYVAFAGGWQYFSYSTMNDEDQVQMKANIFEYLGAISFCTTIVLASFSKVIFMLAFPKDYLAGYIVAPYLFLAPLLLMLYQVIANQFTIVKKTYMNLLALSSGALLNLAFNYFMIPRIGIEGASLATFLGYIVSLIVCIILLKKMKLIIVNKRVYINVTAFLLYAVVWRLFLYRSIVLSILWGFVVCLLYVFQYRSALKAIISKLTNRKK